MGRGGVAQDDMGGPLRMTWGGARAVAHISTSAHSDADVVRARTLGADSVLVSPIFATSSGAPEHGNPETWVKPPRGLDALRSAKACANGQLRIVALGGVLPENAGSCIAAGTDGLAVMRAWHVAANVEAFVLQLLHSAAGAVSSTGSMTSPESTKKASP